MSPHSVHKCRYALQYLEPIRDSERIEQMEEMERIP